MVASPFSVSVLQTYRLLSLFIYCQFWKLFWFLGSLVLIVPPCISVFPRPHSIALVAIPLNNHPCKSVLCFKIRLCLASLACACCCQFLLLVSVSFYFPKWGYVLAMEELTILTYSPRKPICCALCTKVLKEYLGSDGQHLTGLVANHEHEGAA